MDLLPRPSNILMLQKDLISKYKLKSVRIGAEPDARLRIIPFQSPLEENSHVSEGDNDDTGDEFDDILQPNADGNGSSYTVDRLPLLPD